MRIPTRWLNDGYWTGEYDRWRARFDLLLVLPRADGRVRVCVSELARRWRWTPRRARRCVEGLVADGYLLHERRLARGVLYRLCEALVDDSGTVDGGIGEGRTVAEPAAKSLYRVETWAPDEAETPSAEPAADPAEPTVHHHRPAETLLPPAPAAAIPNPRARPSPLAAAAQLTPSERSVAAKVLQRAPHLVDQMLEVWVEFKEVRRRCLVALVHEIPGQAIPGPAVPGQAIPGQAIPGQAIPGQAIPGQAIPGQAIPGQAIPGCRLTQKRAVKILDVLASAGKDRVMEAVGHLPHSHWHCGTGRHARTGTKLCPEAVFTAQQVQILAEIPDRVPVWEQLETNPPRPWFRRVQHVVSTGSARALGVL